MILLFESKLDKQKFIDFAGKFTADDFFRLKQRMRPPYNDIYYWMKKPASELYAYMSDIRNKETQSEMRKEAKKGAKLLVDENGWKVYEIFNYPASVYYGKHTKWCISSKDSYGQHYWDINTKKKNGNKARVFFFIHGNDEKYAVVLWTLEEDGVTRKSAQVWDQEDFNLTTYNRYLPDSCPVIDELVGTKAYKE